MDDNSENNNHDADLLNALQDIDIDEDLEIVIEDVEGFDELESTEVEVGEEEIDWDDLDFIDDSLLVLNQVPSITFVDETNVETSTRNASDTVLYSCESCGKKYKREKNLKKHKCEPKQKKKDSKFNFVYMIFKMCLTV